MKKAPKEPVVSRTETVRKMLPKEPEPTYTEIGRAVDEDGWPIVRCLRSDGKKVKMPIKRFRELCKEGRVQLASPAQKGTTGAVPPQPAPFQLAAKYREASAPPGFFGISCGEHRVTILDNMGCDWQELGCYDHQLQRFVHLKRKDLLPVAAVDAAVELLRSLS